MSHDGKTPTRNPIAAPSKSLPMPVFEYQKLENGFGSTSAPFYGEEQHSRAGAGESEDEVIGC